MERRVALGAVLVLCAVPVALLVNLVSTLRLFDDNVEGPAAIRTYEGLLVLGVVAFLAALVTGVRRGRRVVVVVALVMVPIVLAAGYVGQVPQGRWHLPDDSPGPRRDVPACFSGTDSCAEYGG
ncbi:hypothetical protein [Curtobacterium sp. B18]|uniref:hypothetical protein n=1 Tax=Curtobacterium sp. B18 TaxID=95614 RepID=UPI0003B5C893|nr:hypothetical protein [Curtobacterium sp. B18]